MASMVEHKSIIPNEFSQEARDVRRIRERFIAGEDEQLELLRPVVRDSWLRCREYGVNPGVEVCSDRLESGRGTRRKER